MEVFAKLNDLRISARKVRLVADLIRGRKALEAKEILAFSAKTASRPFAKLLDSALANARNNFHLDEQSLYLFRVLVDDGAKLKRWRPRSRGRAFHIQKKVSHLTIVLKERDAPSPDALRQSEIPGQSPAGIKGKSVVMVPNKSTRAHPRATAGPVKKPKTTGIAKRIFRRKAF